MDKDYVIFRLKQIEKQSKEDGVWHKHIIVEDCEIRGTDYRCVKHPKLKLDRGTANQHFRGRYHKIDFYSGYSLIEHPTDEDSEIIRDGLGRPLNSVAIVMANLIHTRPNYSKKSITFLEYYKNREKIEEKEMRYLNELVESKQQERREREFNFL